MSNSTSDSNHTYQAVMVDIPEATVERTADASDDKILAIGDAQLVAAASCKPASNHNLTWADTFYENEPDIVAVFDLDLDAIHMYQSQSVTKATFWAVVMGFFYGIFVALDMAMLSFFYLILMLALTAKAARRLRAASKKCGLHLAITSISVRYDQEDPLVMTEISLRSITSCTIAQKKIKQYFWSSETNLNMVRLSIVGQNNPKTYVGLKDPRGFARLVMSTKNQDAVRQGSISIV